MTETRAQLYKRCPMSSVALYNVSTLLHFLLGSAGIILGYRAWPWLGYTFGLFYLAFALAETDIAMPLAVCPHGVCYWLRGGLCISGLNGVSRRFANEGDPMRLVQRVEAMGVRER